MPVFSKKSLERLKDAHPDLQKILNEAIKHYDFTILCTFRDKEEQDKAFKSGASKLPWPKSKHNKRPSLAVDIAPYPLDYKHHARFYYLAGLIKGIASQMNIRIRWGGDWDNDNDFTDNKFNDLPHFELII